MQKRFLSIFFSLLLLLNGITPVSAASSPWTQTDWSGGSGQTSWSDSTKFDSSSSVTTSTAGQLTLQATSNWCNNSFCNSSWGYRKKITFDNTDSNLGVTSENLVNFPVMVKLSSSNIDYAKTQNSGQDIRFTDTDGSDLAYEIEKWDESGTSFVWVKVPQIDINSNTDYIYIYYGNSSATDHQQATSVWDSNFKIVQHFEESGNGTAGEYTDSTSNDNDGRGGGGTSTAVPALTSSGQINGAQSFDGINDYVDITNIDFTGEFTFSAWTYTGVTSGTHVIFGEDTGAGAGPKIGFNAGQVFVRVIAGSPDQTISQPSTNAWHLITVKRDSNNKIDLYIDGGSPNRLFLNVAKSGTYTFDIIGANGGSFDQTFNGNLDEIRASNTARSTAWVVAGYHVQTDDFNSFDSEESIYSIGSGSLTSSIFDTEQGSNWGTLTYSATTPSNTSVTIKARSSGSSSMSGATAFSSCTAITSGSDISSNNCITDTHRYIQYQMTLANTDSISTPTFQDISIAFIASDASAPSISLTALSPDPNSDNTPTLTGTATEAVGTVSTVQFQMDGTSGAWNSCTATDGSFNAASEAFACTAATVADGSHTLYVRATDSNGNTTASGSYASDTFTIDTTPPTSLNLDSPGNESYTNTERPTFKWHAASDATSGISSYRLSIDNGDTEDFTISDIPPSRITDYETSTSVVRYENFSDTDSSNNYFSVSTKPSADWGTMHNDGKLKEGKRSWTVTAFDGAGNTTDTARTLFVDYTAPQIKDFSGPAVGTHNGLALLTNRTPSFTGTATDNLALDTGTLELVRETYFLGARTGEEAIATKTYPFSSSTTQTTAPFSFTLDQPLDYGTYRVTLRIKDKAGNGSPLSSYAFTLVTAQQAKALLSARQPAQHTLEQIHKESVVSLPDLEKKALIREKKQAENLHVFTDQVGKLIGQTETVAGHATAFFSEIVLTTIHTVADAGTRLSLAMNTAISSGVTTLTHQTPVAITYVVDRAVIRPFVGMETLRKQSQQRLAEEIGKTQQEVRQDVTRLAHQIGATATIASGKIIGLESSLQQASSHAQAYLAQQHRRMNRTLTAIKQRWVDQPIHNSIAWTNRIATGMILSADTFYTSMFDPSPTRISAVTVEEVGTDYVIISWDTNHYTSNNKVNYGETPSYGQEAWGNNVEKHHVVRLSALKPNTSYTFEVMSQNSQNHQYVYDAYYRVKTNMLH